MENLVNPVYDYHRVGARLMNLKIIIGLLLLLTSSGCIIAGGYSSDRGWFIWPGSIVLILVGLVLFMLMLFRRRG